MKIIVGVVCLAFFLVLGVLFARYYALTEYMRGYNEARTVGQSSSENWSTLWSLINEYKEKNNLPSLKNDNLLCNLADKRAKEVVLDWSHNGFSEVYNTLEYEAYCPGCKAMGENLARGYLTSEDVMFGWITSPSHKKTLDYPYTKGCLGYTSSNSEVFISLVVAK